tara:strand:- start:277 stop:762 length:486 start_codon:yes stop_codon:yes gene_type:complete
MAKEPMAIPDEDYKRVEEAINAVNNEGRAIRDIFESNYEGPVDLEWETDAAVAALEVFSHRWNVEILATIFLLSRTEKYREGVRFNQLRKKLRGISSRTLSDKLSRCQELGLVERIVNDGSPITVHYSLSDHGVKAGRLISPLIAYMKLYQNRVIRHIHGT